MRRDGTAYRFRTEESYTHRAPVLLDARPVPVGGPDAFRHLASLSAQPENWTPMSGQIRQLHCQEDLPSRVAEFELLFLQTLPADLPGVMDRFFAERALPAFPSSQLFVVDMSQELVSRHTLIRGLVSVENNPALTVGGGGRAPGGTGTGHRRDIRCAVFPGGCTEHLGPVRLRGVGTPDPCSGDLVLR